MKERQFKREVILLYCIISAIFIFPLQEIGIVVGIDTGKIKTTDTECVSCYVDSHFIGRGFDRTETMHMILTYADGTEVKAYQKVINKEIMKAYQKNPGALKATYVTSWRGLDNTYAIVELQDINTGQVLLHLDDAREVFWSAGRDLGIIVLVLEVIPTFFACSGKISARFIKHRQTKTRQKNHTRREEQKQRRAQLMAEQSDSAAGDAKVHAKPDPNASKKKRKRR